MATVVNKVVKYSGGDYTTIQAAIDAIPSNLVAADEQWNILIDESGSGSTDWVITSELDLGTRTCDATRYVKIAPNTGKSFRDHASKATNALRVNASNGVRIRNASGGKVITAANCGFLRLVGLQIDKHGSGNPALDLGYDVLVDSCIVRFYAFTTFAVVIRGGRMVNTVVYSTESGALSLNAADLKIEVRNCTLWGGSGDKGITTAYDNDHVVINTAILGFTTPVTDTSHYDAAASGYNATNAGSGTLPGSTGNVYSLTVSSQIESTTFDSEDFRAKSTGSLDGAGTRDQTYTSDLDIVAQARSTSAPWIGAWETPAATPPNAPSGITTSSVSYTSASVSWTDNSSDETGFKVRYAPSPYSSYTTATHSVAASPYLVTGLTDGTSYKAGVAAFNDNGDSTWVESGVFTTSTLSKLRPNTDTSTGSWSASSGSVLYSMVDETSADDADYITSTSATTCKLKFETSTDPADNSNHRINIRARSTSGTLTVKLVQGDPAEATIVSWAPTLTSSFATYQYDLSTAEASVITDYSALYLKLTTS